MLKGSGDNQSWLRPDMNSLVGNIFSKLTLDRFYFMLHSIPYDTIFLRIDYPILKNPSTQQLFPPITRRWLDQTISINRKRSMLLLAIYLLAHRRLF